MDSDRSPDSESYYTCKHRDPGYNATRAALKGAGGPFEGWITSGREWEEFDAEGTCSETANVSH